MLNTIIDHCNSFAQSWAWWIGMSILDAAIVLAVVSALWFAVRRKASPQLGYLLFLLVPLKLFVPLHVAIPDRLFSWTPMMSVARQSAPTVLPSDSRSREKAVAVYAPSASTAEPNERSAAPAMVSEPTLHLGVDKHSHPSLFTWLMLAWLLGVLALLSRLVHAQVRFHRLVIRGANPVDPALFSVDFAALLCRMRVGWHIRIVESDRISSPAVWGILRPTLILPAGIARSLSSTQLEWVLLHELAHVRRRDLAVNCFQRAVGVLHFINPSIWIANRTINSLREYACDDMALAFGRISQVESGEAFLGVMRFAASIQHRPQVNLDGAMGAFESTARASCFERMKRLLDTNRRVGVKLGLGSICVLLLTAALALPQIRAANPQPAEEKVAEKVADKKEEPRPSAGKAVAEKKKEKKSGKDAVFHFSVIIARHAMLLEGKEIVTWRQIEEIIAKRPNPSQTEPSFCLTHGAFEAGVYESAKREMWRLHRDYKLVGHSIGSVSPRSSLWYDKIKTPLDLKPDEALRVDGTVLDKKGKPIANADVILVTPIDDSIPYRGYEISLVQGRVWNPLDHVLTRSSERGRFAIYPPKGQNFFLIALHPDGGIGSSGRNQFAHDHKIHLLEWAGLTSKFSEEAEEQTAFLTTNISPSGDIPEINFTQGGSVLKKPQPPLLFSFTRVPPIFQTTISRGFSQKEGMSFSLPGASVGLLPGETRRLDLGPLTKQQRQQLERMRSRL